MRNMTSCIRPVNDTELGRTKTRLRSPLALSKPSVVQRLVRIQRSERSYAVLNSFEPQPTNCRRVLKEEAGIRSDCAHSPEWYFSTVMLFPWYGDPAWLLLRRKVSTKSYAFGAHVALFFNGQSFGGRCVDAQIFVKIHFGGRHRHGRTFSGDETCAFSRDRTRLVALYIVMESGFGKCCTADGRQLSGLITLSRVLHGDR